MGYRVSQRVTGIWPHSEDEWGQLKPCRGKAVTWLLERGTRGTASLEGRRGWFIILLL